VLGVLLSSSGCSSDDGGRSVLNSNAEMSAALKKAAEILNLKPHVVGLSDSKQTLHVCGDIEGHLVRPLSMRSKRKHWLMWSRRSLGG
jgi:hypothetical protein